MTDFIKFSAKRIDAICSSEPPSRIFALFSKHRFGKLLCLRYAIVMSSLIGLRFDRFAVVQSETKVVTDTFASFVKVIVRVPPVPRSTDFVACLVSLQFRVFSVLVMTVLLMSRPQLESHGSWIVFLTAVFEVSTHQKTCIV